MGAAVLSEPDGTGIDALVAGEDGEEGLATDETRTKKGTFIRKPGNEGNEYEKDTKKGTDRERS